MSPRFILTDVTVEEWSNTKFKIVRYPATITLEEVCGDQLPTFMRVVDIKQDGPEKED